MDNIFFFLLIFINIKNFVEQKNYYIFAQNKRKNKFNSFIKHDL